MSIPVLTASSGITCVAARADDNLVSDTFFHAEFVQSLHVLVVNIVVGNDCGSEDRLCIFFDTSVNHLFYRYGSAEVYAFDTPFFDTAVLDIDDLSHTYGVFVFTDCTAEQPSCVRVLRIHHKALCLSR